jgi:murein DD-endopeptidase MepM/ murein hydrolase activator NlpD
MAKIRNTTAFILLICAGKALAQYPEMSSLTRDDPLFVQLQDDIALSYRASRERKAPDLPPPAIFTYRRKPSEDLFSLNARLNLPYDAIATLNSMESASSINNLDRVLICSRPGIFIHDPPRTELEQMMLGSRINGGLVPQKLVVWRYGFKETYSFFPGSMFNEVERAYFLHILFRFPISQGTITSRYGARANPFSGHPEFHNGIDIGAPIGTEVCAAREGKVAEVGSSPSLGAYVILAHPGGFRTVYGHLSAISVTLGVEVRTGAVIGKVGMTGLSTGPHLHFEVRAKGGSTDPSPYLLVKK